MPNAPTYRDEAGEEQGATGVIIVGPDGSFTDLNSIGGGGGAATIADGADVTQGAKADAKSTATDTTPITAMSVWKQISASVQVIATSIAGTLTVATHAVTGSGNFATTVADAANVTMGAKADAKSTATDSTAITAMQVWKQISASVQSLVSGLVALGQTTMAASLPVAIASNQSPLPVQDAAASTATLTALASAATSAQLLASTAGRLGLMLFNTDANGVYIKYGTTASATSFTVLIPTSGYWEMPKPIYTGRIDAIWAADGSGSLYATEMT